MKLKKLEILGFKSFKDKTIIHLSEGISAVVGPNGCGKSNIVDAIRWVMGEQRVTTLRGKRMDDVIFNGSNDSPPLGMAEVSITLQNNGRISSNKYAGLQEITISRRIFREGESEYYINKAPCRLLDIREFFMDAGAGVRTYSIVEQEKVSRLVEAKPEERRQFIEEAAGIAKYKMRRESASRKMESTRQNITRLNDIVREVKSRLNSTKRQAKQAEEYKTLRKSIKEAQLTLSLQAYAETVSGIEDLGKLRESLVARSIEAETCLKALEASAEAMKSEFAESEEVISKLNEEFYGIKNKIGIKEKEITFSEQNIVDLKVKRGKSLSETEELKKNEEDVKKESAALESQTKELSEKIASMESLVAENRDEADRLRDIEATLGKELEREKFKRIDIATENARLKNLSQSLSKSIEDLERKILSECREADENNAKLKKLKDGLSALKSDLSNDLKDIELLREKRKVAVEKAAKLKEELKAAEDGIEKLKSEKGKKSSRLVSLKELQDGYESCNEGTRSVMKAAGKAALPKDRIHGLAADCIVVPKEYEAAVEAVLGEKLQYIVVQNREDGAAAIDYLKSLPSGRTSFVPLDADGAGRSVKLPDRSEDAVRLADFVLPADEKFRSIVSYLIEDAVLVPTLDDGIRIGKSGDFSGTFVTRQGDIINSCGVLTGGKETNGGGSMLRNRREIAELEREIERLSSSLEGELQAKNKTVSLISSADTEAADSGSKIHELELSINGIRKDIERSESEIKWIEQRINVLVFNKENLESEKIKAAEKIKEIEKDAASHESRAAAIDRDISSLQEKWRGAKSDLEEKEKSLVKEKILLTSIREKRNSGDETLKRLAAAISDIENRIRQNADDAVSCEAKIAKITENIEEEKATLTNLYEEHKKTETELSEKRTLQTEKEVTLKSKEAEIQKAKKNFEAVSKELNECEMEIREISIRMEAIKNSAKEKFSLDPEAALPEFAGISESEAEELGRELEQNKKKLENFAEVNLLALNEYEQLKERYDFLAGQIADLNSSLDTLKGTITRINHISKKKFFETFEAVNNCFKDIFPKLFPGGKGKLVLTDESNILETGIDIDIQISGKKRQNLSLLSGGEKALSAVALIFSILTHRPTPFLIFDEVDAPLDDVNVSLFRKLMKEIALNSQIILITHNKKTMEIADDLIGATMEKNGISTIVSVSMN